MLHLFIDTATEKAFIGLANDDQLIGEVHLPVGVHNSKLFFPALVELFRSHQIQPKDLGLISCGVGPGSYTGIRVGASAAQAMAYALSIPLVGICSLEAYRPSDEKEPFAILLDARVAGFYVLKQSGGPEALEVDTAAQKLKEIPRLISPHPEQIKQRLTLQGIWEEGTPSGHMFAAKAFGLFRAGEVVKNGTLPLLYLRKTEAEMKHC
jgi:tRNA threonylcarbamoyladenosine biosynthesis protein TsaB